jgi:hypothetical protein
MDNKLYILILERKKEEEEEMNNMPPYRGYFHPQQWEIFCSFCHSTRFS